MNFGKTGFLGTAITGTGENVSGTVIGVRETIGGCGKPPYPPPSWPSPAFPPEDAPLVEDPSSLPFPPLLLSPFQLQIRRLLDPCNAVGNLEWLLFNKNLLWFSSRQFVLWKGDCENKILERVAWTLGNDEGVGLSVEKCLAVYAQVAIPRSYVGILLRFAIKLFLPQLFSLQSLAACDAGNEVTLESILSFKHWTQFQTTICTDAFAYYFWLHEKSISLWLWQNRPQTVAA